MLLMDRASFYLQPGIISIYLPLTLGQRRSLLHSGSLFREAGMAHLLAISGLHIAMIFSMFYLMIGKLFGFRGKLLEWVHFNYLIQVLVFVVLWGYLFLLNWPVTAFGATCMICILVLGYSLDHAQVPMYSLVLTSFIFCFRNR